MCQFYIYIYIYKTKKMLFNKTIEFFLIKLSFSNTEIDKNSEINMEVTYLN